MPDPTRESAFDLLTAVLERHRPLEEALGALPALEPRDRAAAHRLAAAVLRRMGTLDAVLDKRALRETDLRAVMRSGAGDDELEAVIRAAVWRKELKHHIGDPGFVQPDRTMSAIGG